MTTPIERILVLIWMIQAIFSGFQIYEVLIIRQDFSPCKC